MTDSLTISLGQFDTRWGQPDHNMARVREWVAEAAQRGSDVVVFPELWDTGFVLDRAVELGTGATEGRFAEVAELAQEHAIHIVGSMLELGHPQGTSRPAYNTAMWFSPDGASPGSYRKMHLFRPYDEDKYLLPGISPHWLNLPWGMSSIGICYDLRFPELFRSYAVAGCWMCFLPAQWPYPREMHWLTLLRARAIENQMIIVACNRVGQEGDQVFCGRSTIIDAWGETVIEGGDQEELLTATVDLAHVNYVRENWPVFEDRRPDAYDID